MTKVVLGVLGGGLGLLALAALGAYATIPSLRHSGKGKEYLVGGLAAAMGASIFLYSLYLRLQ